MHPVLQPPPVSGTFRLSPDAPGNTFSSIEFCFARFSAQSWGHSYRPKRPSGCSAETQPRGGGQALAAHGARGPARPRDRVQPRRPHSPALPPKSGSFWQSKATRPSEPQAQPALPGGRPLRPSQLAGSRLRGLEPRTGGGDPPERNPTNLCSAARSSSLEVPTRPPSTTRLTPLAGVAPQLNHPHLGCYPSQRGNSWVAVGPAGGAFDLGDGSEKPEFSAQC